MLEYYVVNYNILKLPESIKQHPNILCKEEMFAKFNSRSIFTN